VAIQNACLRNRDSSAAGPLRALLNVFANQTRERPETWVTLRTGHMGYTFRPLRRQVPMLWKETPPVEERLGFVARLLEGEPIAALRHLGLRYGRVEDRRTLNVFA
jgi:hypothetical protein